MKNARYIKVGMTVMFVALASMVYADSYPLATCPVAGGKLGAMGDPIIENYDGREVRFCCEGCPTQYEKDPAKYNAKIDAQIAEQQKTLYPLDTCLVSGGKLGGMGDIIEYVHNNRLVRLCCDGCIEMLKKDPAKFLTKLDDAVIEKQKAAYALKTCPVSGDKLGDGALDYITGNRLVRLCCEGCVKMFEKEPAKYLSVLNDDSSASKSEGSSEKDSSKSEGSGSK